MVWEVRVMWATDETNERKPYETKPDRRTLTMASKLVAAATSRAARLAAVARRDAAAASRSARLAAGAASRAARLAAAAASRAARLKRRPPLDDAARLSFRYSSEPPDDGKCVTKEDIESDEAVWALFERYCKSFNRKYDHAEMVRRFNKFKFNATNTYHWNTYLHKDVKELARAKRNRDLGLPVEPWSLLLCMESLKLIVRIANSHQDARPDIKDTLTIAEAEILEDQLLVALGHRILELLERPLQLAKEAIGIMYLSQFSVRKNEALRRSKWVLPDFICSREAASLQGSYKMPTIKLAPMILWRELFAEACTSDMERFYCPFPNCSVLLDLSQHFSRASTSSQSDLNCAECSECHRDICINCGSLPVDERDTGDLSLHWLAQNIRWRCCQRCRRMIELTQGCFHMNCWCWHEFCYSCGAEYTNDMPMCVLGRREHRGLLGSTFHPSMPTAIEGYSEQERAQLALIQRFLSGGFNLGEPPSQSPPRCADSYIIDTMKDLHQLPWLERFVSVISDSYNEDYIQ
uniref:RBR-type E3 ubiquitin transferase n=1 Tax=Oryza punctata TaxID=4537 RepID=A0A0E0MPW9_ORYPU